MRAQLKVRASYASIFQDAAQSDCPRSAEPTRTRDGAQRRCTEDNKENKFVINPSPATTHILNLLFKESSKHNLSRQFLFFSSHFAPLETINLLFIISLPFRVLVLSRGVRVGAGVKTGAGNPLSTR
jgi:hypothetical protein